MQWLKCFEHWNGPARLSTLLRLSRPSGSSRLSGPSGPFRQPAGARSLALCALLLGGSTTLGLAQATAPAQGAQQPKPPAAASSEPAKPSPDAAATAAADSAAKPAAQPDANLTPQQKQLAEDTAQLLTLANELKAEMDKSSKDTLSLNVVKKADQIEKLARKVRAEMRASIGVPTVGN
jgi:hypothetical protein